jgi:hypothetical protein
MLVDRHAVPRWLLFVAGHLFALHLFTGFVEWADFAMPLRIYWRSFHLDNEISVGTWFNSILLLSVSAAALWAGRCRELATERRFWLLIAALFFALSADEVGALHEHMSRTLDLRLNLPSYLRFAWVLPAGILVFALTLYFARFVFRQEKSVKNGILAAAAIYLSGALGLEMLGSHIAFTAGTGSIGYLLACGFEELLEMCGCIRMLSATLTALPLGAKIELA